MTKMNQIIKFSIPFFIGLIGFSISTTAQDTLKQIKPTITGQSTRAAASLPRADISRIKELNATPTVDGTYTIDRYAIQFKKSGNKNVIKTVGTNVIVTEISLSGSAFDSLAFQISEIEIMSIEDYLYRIFGELPAKIPTDLPEHLYVHKTNNLTCYAIGQLPDGTLLIPREGILLYLKKV